MAGKNREFWAQQETRARQNPPRATASSPRSPSLLEDRRPKRPTAGPRRQRQLALRAAWRYRSESRAGAGLSYHRRVLTTASSAPAGLVATGGIQSVRVAESGTQVLSILSETPSKPRKPGTRVSQLLYFNKAAPSTKCQLSCKGRGARGTRQLAPPSDVTYAVASLSSATGPGVMAALGGDGLRLLSVSRPERQPESAALSGPGSGLCCWVSVFSCFSLACSYVGSLYVWKSELPRCGGCARGRDLRPRGAGLRAELGPDGGGAALAWLLQAPRNLLSLFLGTTPLLSSGVPPVSW